MRAVLVQDVFEGVPPPAGITDSEWYHLTREKSVEYICNLLENERRVTELILQ